MDRPSGGRDDSKRRWNISNVRWRLIQTRYDTHSALGLCLLDAGKLDDAIAELQKAVEMEPSHAINHANLGTALLGGSSRP